MTLRAFGASHLTRDDPNTGVVVLEDTAGDSPPPPPSDPFIQGARTLDTTSGNTTVLSFPSDVTGMNLIVISVGWDDTSAGGIGVDVEDSSNNGIAVAQGPDFNPVLNYNMATYYCTDFNGGPDTITVTWAANTTNRRVVISEFSGGYNFVDAGSAATGTSNQPSASLTTLQPDDLLYSWTVSSAGVSGAQAPSNYQSATGAADQVATDPGTYTTTFDSPGTGHWTTQYVSFYASVAS